jgi:hypothetical protein
MCNQKRVFLVSCIMIVGLCSSTMQAWPWGLEARKTHVERVAIR